MQERKWIFKENKNVMVLATKRIVTNKEPIRTVYHDEEDGMWQFLDGTDLNEDDVMIVALNEVVDIDNTVEDIFDLPLGWVAWREEKGEQWFRKKEDE